MAPLLGTALATLVGASCFVVGAQGWMPPIAVPSAAATTTTVRTLEGTQRWRLSLLQSRLLASLALQESRRRRIGSPLRASSSSSSSPLQSVESISAAASSTSPTEEREGSVARTATAPRPMTPSSAEHLATSLVDAIRSLPKARSPAERSDLYQTIQSTINSLEGLYQPPQTLGFFAAILEGDWHHLFATHRGVGAIGGAEWFEEEAEDEEGVGPEKVSWISSGRVILHNTDQSLDCRGRRGNLTTTVAWEWLPPPRSEEGPWSVERDDDTEAPTPSISSKIGGTFQIRSDFDVTDSGRLLLLPTDDRTIRPHRGSDRRLEPKDVPPLVRQLRRAIPPTLFGLPQGQQAADITYLDAVLRIVRYTGGPATLEGARDLFFRSRLNRRESTDRDER